MLQFVALFEGLKSKHFSLQLNWWAISLCTSFNLQHLGSWFIYNLFISDEQNDFNKTCVRVRQNSEDSIGSDISLSPPTSPIHGPEVIEKSTVSWNPSFIKKVYLNSHNLIPVDIMIHKYQGAWAEQIIRTYFGQMDTCAQIDF